MTGRWRTLCVLAALATLALTSDEAQAVIGRPMTPVSYAGVARRTTRRQVRRGAYAGAYAAPTYAPPPGEVSSLPAGCTTVASGGTTVYNCNGSTYTPYYDGPNVVYVQ